MKKGFRPQRSIQLIKREVAAGDLMKKGFRQIQVSFLSERYRRGRRPYEEGI